MDTVSNLRPQQVPERQQQPLSPSQFFAQAAADQAQAPESLDYTTLCGAVANKIREEILSGALKPGQRLDQIALAERFGISRMPIRDAFRILEGEGLVRLKHGRGACVAMVDLVEFLEIYQVREVLEEQATRLSIPRISDEALDYLEELVHKMEEDARQGDLGRWTVQDRDFHLAAYQACQNATLLKLITSFWNTSQQYRRVFLSMPDETERTLEAHKRLMAAFRARDGELAGRLIREHIRNTVHCILRLSAVDHEAQPV